MTFSEIASLLSIFFWLVERASARVYLTTGKLSLFKALSLGNPIVKLCGYIIFFRHHFDISHFRSNRSFRR